MAIEVVIPNLGYTMTEAKILQWVKKVGDMVEVEEPILEIETDKVTYLIEAPAGGVLKATLAGPDDVVPVGGVVGLIGEADEEVDLGIYRKEVQVESAERPVGAELAGEAVARPAREGRIFASPVARRMARDKGIDLSLIRGTGRSGRIRKADVERYAAEVKVPEAERAVAGVPGEVVESIAMDGMRKAIARRLSESFRDVPHINQLIEVDMTEAISLRVRAKERAEVRWGVKVSLNDLFIKAVAVCLRDHPLLNARLSGDRIEVLRDINIGLAVALDNGLIVPALERADEKRLWQIARERTDLVERAREGRLRLQELERGTFTISNLGMYDIVSFTSIINPPQSGILSIGKTLDRAVVEGGAVVVRPMVNLTLAVDHRVVDGAVAARFLQDLKNALEDPSLLL